MDARDARLYGLYLRAFSSGRGSVDELVEFDEQSPDDTELEDLRAVAVGVADASLVRTYPRDKSEFRQAMEATS